MALTQQDYATIRQAAIRYNYPAQVYDTAGERIITLAGIAEVETYIGSRLRAGDTRKVHEGLASVLAWGHANAGYQMTRVRKFLDAVTEAQLVRVTALLAEDAIAGVSGGQLVYELGKLALPELTKMAFASKVVMFADPKRFAVLDSKIANLLDTLPAGHALAGLKRYPTAIPITAPNAALYDKWAAACQHIAEAGGIGAARAVDAERAFFYLAGGNQLKTASEILSRWG